MVCCPCFYFCFMVKCCHCGPWLEERSMKRLPFVLRMKIVVAYVACVPIKMRSFEHLCIFCELPSMCRCKWNSQNYLRDFCQLYSLITLFYCGAPTSNRLWSQSHSWKQATIYQDLYLRDVTFQHWFFPSLCPVLSLTRTPIPLSSQSHAHAQRPIP